MRAIIHFVIKNKFAVWLLTIIVAAAGLYAGLNMKEETIPDISTPVLTVSTTYPGATPKEVADQVSEPIEKRLENLSGVNTVSSSSSENVSTMQIEYRFSKDMDEAEKEAKEALSDVDLPDQAKDPNVSSISIDAFPILSLSVSNRDQPLPQLTETVKDKVVPELEGTEGVSSVEVSGQTVNKVELDLNEDKMVEQGLDKKSVKQAIQGSAVTFPLGVVRFDDSEKSVLVDGDVDSVKDLKNVRIPLTPGAGQGGQQKTSASKKMKQGRSQSAQGQDTAAQGKEAQSQQTAKLKSVKLKDIADVNLVSKSDSISRTNGKRSIGIQIVKGSEANTVDVANRVKDKVAQLESDNGDMSIVTMLDQAEPIEDSVNTMLSKALLGALFAVIIIMLFLRDVRSTIISIVSIPMSLLIALLVLNQLDITLNIMTLGAMTVAIGRVVDDSIVVIENIYRRMALSTETLTGGVLIREATKQMFMPILSSTIVTIAVFLPLALVTGPVGQMFMPFALAVVFALSASLLVAITIVPMLAHAMFKKGLSQRRRKHRGPGPIVGFYKKALNGVLNHKLISFGIAILMLVGSLLLVPRIGTSFLPSQGQKFLVATYSSEPGQTRDDVEDIAGKAEKYLLDRDGVKTLQYSVGGGNPMSPGNSNDALFFVEYQDDVQHFDAEKDKVLAHLQKQTNKGEWGSQDMGAAPDSGRLTMYVYGDTLDDVQPAVGKLTDRIKKEDTFSNVDTSLSESYDQYTLLADQKKMRQYGLSAAQVGSALQQTGEQDVLTTVQKDDEDVNVYFATQKQGYDNLDDLKNTKIKSPLGQKVALKKVVDVKKGQSPDTITRRGGRIYAEVTTDMETDDAGAATQEMKETVDDLDLPSAVDVEFGGVTQDMNEAFTQLGLAMLAAIAIVYLVLVITFGGALAPFAILFSLPFTVIGGLLALYVSGATLSVSAMIGALMLIGIVVTNAIVLIDRVIHQEKEGLSTREALLEGGMTRLRPILMTALATIGALAPLAVGLEGGGGGLISKGLGITVIGGLTSSTVLTLFIVPVVYEFLMKFRRKHPSEGEE